MTPSEAHAAFCEVMTLRAEQMLAEGSSPYDVAIDLCGDVGGILEWSWCAGHALGVWGFLTDGIDGPEHYARGLSGVQVAALMRHAASEWLRLDQQSEPDLEAYFERWRNWPESVADLL